MRWTCCITTALLASALAACASSPVALVALPPAPYAATEHSDSRSAQTTILLRPWSFLAISTPIP